MALGHDKNGSCRPDNGGYSSSLGENPQGKKRRKATTLGRGKGKERMKMRATSAVFASDPGKEGSEGNKLCATERLSEREKRNQLGWATRSRYPPSAQREGSKQEGKTGEGRTG